MDLLLNNDFLRFYNQDLIAKSGVKSLYDMSLDEKDEAIFKKLFESRELLLQKNPENIVLRNSMNYFLGRLPTRNILDEIKSKNTEVIHKINKMNSEASIIGAKKIKPGSTVFVHSINNNLLEILMHAAKYKHFSVRTVRHMPFMLGSALKKKLARSEIKTTVYSDLSLKEAITHSDICFIGAEAILKKGCIAKTGSNTASRFAEEQNIPLYYCAHSLKYDHDKKMKEFLDSTVTVDDNVSRVFEYVPPENIGLYITDLGILKPEYMVDELKMHHKWLFNPIS